MWSGGKSLRICVYSEIIRREIVRLCVLLVLGKSGNLVFGFSTDRLGRSDNARTEEKRDKSYFFFSRDHVDFGEN